MRLGSLILYSLHCVALQNVTVRAGPVKKIRWVRPLMRRHATRSPDPRCYPGRMRLSRRQWIAVALAVAASPLPAFWLYKAYDQQVSQFVESRPALRDLRNRIRFHPPPERFLSCVDAAPSPIPRFESPGVVIDGKLYVFGGFTPPGLTASSRCDYFDPDDGTWTRFADLPAPVTHAAVASAGSQVWLVGGFTGDHPGPATNTVWLYDAADDSWSRQPPLPALRAAGGAAIVGRTLHFLGGSQADRGTDSGDHWTLDLDAPQTGWRFAPPLPSPRHHFAAAVHDGKILVLGGQRGHDPSGADTARTDVFDPPRASGRGGRRSCDPNRISSRGRLSTRASCVSPAARAGCSRRSTTWSAWTPAAGSGLGARPCPSRCALRW